MRNTIWSSSVLLTTTLSALCLGFPAPNVAKAQSIGYTEMDDDVAYSDFRDTHVQGYPRMYHVAWSADRVGDSGANAASVSASIDDGGMPGNTGIRIMVHCTNWPLRTDLELATLWGEDSVELNTSYKCDPGAGVEYFSVDYKVECYSAVWASC